MHELPKHVWSPSPPNGGSTVPKPLQPETGISYLDHPFGTWFCGSHINAYELCTTQHIAKGLAEKIAINSISTQGKVTSYSYYQVDQIASY